MIAALTKEEFRMMIIKERTERKLQEDKVYMDYICNYYRNKAIEKGKRIKAGYKIK